MSRLLLPLALLLSVSGCASWFASEPQYLPKAPTATAEPPYACAEDLAQRSEVLELTPTAPRLRPTNAPKSAPLVFANKLFVGELVDHIARLTPFDNGWSSYALRVHSQGAQSLSAHLTRLQLPAGSEIWWCSPDRSLRHGPFREAPKGELWTPEVTGDEAWLEILVPSRQRRQFQVTLAEVNAGFQ